MVTNPHGDVAVVIAVKNGMPYIDEAVASAIAQSAEVIVVDDGSSDGTFEAVLAQRDSRLRVIRNPGSGVSAARNAGTALARAHWLMFLDADDRLTPRALDGLLEASLQTSVMVYGDYERIDGSGRTVGNRSLSRKWRLKPSGNLFATLLAGNFIINGGVAICSREAVVESGGFDEALSLCEDWHLWSRLAAMGDVTYTPRHVLDYRVHNASVMMGALRGVDDCLPALEAMFGHPNVARRLSTEKVRTLRLSAEIDLMIYWAQQSVRSGAYRRAASIALTAANRAPSRTFRILTRCAGAFARM